MTDQQTTQTSDTTPGASPESAAPLPGEGTGGCLGLITGVAVMLVLSLIVTVIGYSVVHLFGGV